MSRYDGRFQPYFNRNDKVLPSTDTLFIRGLTNRRKPDEIREYIEDEAGCKLTIEFLKINDQERRMFIALRFPSRDLAKEILDKYDNGTLLGERVTVSWFKDLRKANNIGGRPGRFNFYPRSKSGWVQKGRTVIRSPVIPFRERFVRDSASHSSYSRSRSRSRSMSRPRSSSRSRSNSSESAKKLRSTVRRNSSGSDRQSHGKDEEGMLSSRKLSTSKEERRIVNVSKLNLDYGSDDEVHKEDIQPSRSLSKRSPSKGKDASEERQREKIKSKKRSHSSGSEKEQRKETTEEEFSPVKKEEPKEKKKKKHKSSSKKRHSKRSSMENLSDGEIDSMNSHGPASPPPYQPEDDQNHDMSHMDDDIDRILEANQEPEKVDESFEEPAVNTHHQRGHAPDVTSQEQDLEMLLSTHFKADKAGEPVKAGLSTEQMLLIRDKKDDLERAYKTDCETFVMVCKMLISKDSSLEERVLPSLRENLKEIGQRCILELREFMDRIQGDDSLKNLM